MPPTAVATTASSWESASSSTLGQAIPVAIGCDTRCQAENVGGLHGFQNYGPRLGAHPFDLVGNAEPVGKTSHRFELYAGTDMDQAPCKRRRQAGESLEQAINTLLLDSSRYAQEHDRIVRGSAIAKVAAGMPRDADEIETVIDQLDPGTRR